MMKRFQTRVKALLAAALFTTAFPASAQETPENYVPYPYAFIGLQGGGQVTFGNCNNWELVSPTASVSVGVHFTPVIGARVHVNGIWNKSGVRIDGFDHKFKYKYATTDLDVMLNLVNLIAKGNYHPVNVYLIGGVGLNYAWDTKENPNLYQYISSGDRRSRLSHNFRVGTMLDVNVARNWSVNLEVDANSLSDRYNCLTNGHDDWQLTAQLGVTYKFGVRRKIKDTRASEIIETPVITTGQTETTAAQTVVKEEKPVVPEAPKPQPKAKEKTDTSIFFKIASSSIQPTEQAKLATIAQWIKSHPEAKVTITGYADKGTGSASVNARYAKQRAEAVQKALTDKYGIAASRISVDSKGDTIQPFTDNDSNRVTIVIAEE
ncbi:MAG: OmpA family protein [Bacteroidaceae bacterium]|nr:OmpA family protein [Bacteroidaceae bacterium]MBQ9170144.1 OmpA family protein [Bacteroidaceae bacterium]